MGLLAIMLNEIDYVDRWVKVISRAQSIGVPFDQVVVVDGGSTDGTADRLRSHGVHVVERPFDGHFANQRNFCGEHMTTDWVFELDADEIASTPLIAGLRPIAGDMERDRRDCVGLARLNLLDDHLVVGPGHMGLDYQYRLHRRGCRWRGAVHEEITGYQARFELPINDGHFIIHDKTSGRHATRNAYYDTLTP